MKHDREEPLHLGWMADRGAKLAPLDAQGFLKEEPKRDSVSTEYERLLDGLYHAARRAMNGEMLDIALDDYDPRAGHVLREAARDEEKEIGAASQPSDANHIIDTAAYSPQKWYDEIATRLFTTDKRRGEDIPPPDNTTEAGFTEEELKNAKAWFLYAGFPSFRAAMEYCRHRATVGEGLYTARQWERRAACAEHLAREGE